MFSSKWRLHNDLAFPPTADEQQPAEAAAAQAHGPGGQPQSATEPGVAGDEGNAGARNRGPPDLFKLAARALLDSCTGEEVQASGVPVRGERQCVRGCM